MRVIKFRGKVISTGKWISGYYFVNLGEHFIAPDEYTNPLADASHYMIDPNTLGQFTGITDADDNEIYEGDIIEHRISAQQRATLLVRWDDNTASWAVDWRTPINDFEELANFERRARVIGNYHENPELLRKEPTL